MGTEGYITTTSSINASSFFGDGSHLIDIPTLASNQIWTGANTFSSSFTVRSGGRQIILSTSSVTNNIFISSTGALTFYPSLHNISSTTIPSVSRTDTLFGNCIANSTLTITTSGGRVEVFFAGMISGNTNNTPVGLNFLEDGQFVGNLSSTKGIIYKNVGSVTAVTSSFSYLLDVPPPGAHSYCLTIAGFNGNGVSIENTSGLNDYIGQRNIFFIQEIK
jgi:hypothetical protein